jgi:cobalamin-dependent methionine synthase I
MVAVAVMAVMAITAGMRMGVVFAIDIGVTAQALEDFRAEQPGDERAEKRQEDDGG